MPVDLEAFDLGENYGLSRERLSQLVRSLIEESTDPASVPVPACPGWSVHDVLAHLVAVVEDAMSGKLTGPPSEDMTAEQVERRRGATATAMLEEWAEMSPAFETALNGVRIWPGFLDVLAHEHDVRGAMARPGGRESEAMSAASEWLLSFWSPPVSVTVRNAGQEHVVGTESGAEETGSDSGGGAGGDGAMLTLTTSPFEVFRFRLGRRSRAQLRAMAWSGDPTPVMDHLVLFGPEPYDVVE